MKAVEAVLPEEETELEGRIDFDALVAGEQKRLFLLCLRLLRDRDEVDSATQDVFVEAYQAMAKRGKPAILEPAKWLTRVALNTCYDRLRSKRWRFWQRHSSNADGDAQLRFLPALGPNQENAAAARDIGRRLERALERLSARQRAVFTTTCRRPTSTSMASDQGCPRLCYRPTRSRDSSTTRTLI